MILFHLNDNRLLIEGLKDSSRDVTIEAGTVQVTLLDEDGDEVGGQAWPTALTHLGSGDWEAILDEEIAVTVDAEYTAVVEVEGASDAKARWDLPCEVKKRLGTDL